MVGDGIDINPSNACLSVFSFPLFFLSFRSLAAQEKKHKDLFLTKSCALRSRGTYLLEILVLKDFFFFGVRKSAQRSDSRFHGGLEIRGDFFLLFPEEVKLKVLLDLFDFSFFNSATIKDEGR